MVERVALSQEGSWFESRSSLDLYVWSLLVPPVSVGVFSPVE